ncbi:MAG: type IV secretion system protein VirB10 [Alphaproteobacteria bacterium]|nr:type IV secretion system protein VirB10 [Alphaproteobacteria bacterium]
MSNQEKKEAISGEREIATVAAKKSPPKIMGAVILIGAVIVLYYVLTGNNEGQKTETASNLTLTPTVEFRGQNQIPQNEQLQPQIQPPITEPVLPPAIDERSQLIAASRRAPSTAFSNWSATAPTNSSLQSTQTTNTSPYVVTGVGSPPSLLGNSGSGNDLGSRLQPTYMDGVRAGLLPDRNFLITKGTLLPCLLKTALDSSLPGMAVCEINRDILSASGKVVLLEKGTKVVGEYRGGLRQGDRRIFVLWTRAETPNGVIINLDSPAADPLGRSGFDGMIDTQFWTRFGGALLLSLVDTGFEALSSLAGQETSNAAKEPAAIALENTGNVPIILRKNQGEEVAIFVARDMDFSTVYSLRQKK